MVDVILAIIWIAILALYIVVGWKDAKSNNEVKKEITQMNELLLEQNSQLWNRTLSSKNRISILIWLF